MQIIRTCTEIALQFSSSELRVLVVMTFETSTRTKKGKDQTRSLSSMSLAEPYDLSRSNTALREPAAWASQLESRD